MKTFLIIFCTLTLASIARAEITYTKDKNGNIVKVESTTVSTSDLQGVIDKLKVDIQGKNGQLAIFQDKINTWTAGISSTQIIIQDLNQKIADEQNQILNLESLK